MVGQAAHIVDAIHWFMGSSFPSAVTCAAGQVNLPGAEVPETTTMAIEYPQNFLAVFTLGYKAMRYHWFNDQLKQFHGSEARLDVGREWYRLYPASREIEIGRGNAIGDSGFHTSEAPIALEVLDDLDDVACAVARRIADEGRFGCVAGWQYDRASGCPRCEHGG